jgi:hypothetical protein
MLQQDDVVQQPIEVVSTLKQDQGLLPEDGELIQKTTGTKSSSTTSRGANRLIFDVHWKNLNPNLKSSNIPPKKMMVPIRAITN